MTTIGDSNIPTLTPEEVRRCTQSTVRKAGANRTTGHRSRLALRIATSLARVRHDEILLGHEALLIDGEDGFG